VREHGADNAFKRFVATIWTPSLGCGRAS